MAEWRIIGLSGLINAALTLILIIIFFPLFFLGPLMGGFLASYLSHGYEYYDKMDLKDGIVVGAISGIIGGLIITLLLILGFGAISIIIKLVSSKIGIITSTNTLIAAYIIFEFSVIISSILGAIGGTIGVIVKRAVM
jgi:Family of unknown function (DUF5518)